MQIHELSGEELKDVAGEFWIPHTPRTHPDLRGRVEVQELGEAFKLSRTHWGGPISAVRNDRTAATATASESNLLLFYVEIASESRHYQHDRFVELAANSGVLKEARSPWKWASPINSRNLTLRFSRELLPLRTAEITESCARSIDPATPAMQLLSSYLDRLFDTADELTGDRRRDAGRVAVELLAMALRDVTPSLPGVDGSARVLLDVMRTHVRKHLADPQLRVEELARRHHVSVRHAYSLFERIGTTPGAYLREQRLLAARTMLSNPRYDRLAIASIAAAVGFLELSTFERAFRRQYGTTPAAWRREHLHHSGPLP